MRFARPSTTTAYGRAARSAGVEITFQLRLPPPQVDAFGLGVRIPTWVISPWAKPGHLEPAVYDLTSILKFIERVFGLGTLAAANHRFDTATPVGGDYQAAAPGASAGPPAPPRDDRSEIGDLFECFTF